MIDFVWLAMHCKDKNNQVWVCLTFRLQKLGTLLDPAICYQIHIVYNVESTFKCLNKFWVRFLVVNQTIIIVAGQLSANNFDRRMIIESLIGTAHDVFYVKVRRKWAVF